MANTRVATIADSYKYAFKNTGDLVADLSDTQRTFQAAEGKGHALWFVGHLAFSLDLIVNQWFLNGESVIPKEYGAKFAPGVMGGGPVSAQASDYPAWEEVLENYRKAGAKTLELLDGLKDEELEGDLQGNIPDQARGYFGNLGQSLIGMAAHDSHHRGQIAMLKALSG